MKKTIGVLLATMLLMIVGVSAYCHDGDSAVGWQFGKTNYYLQSYLWDGKQVNYDRCLNANLLLEYYCNNGVTKSITTFYCVNGCNNGVCIR